MTALFANLLFGHLLADFSFQSERWVREKRAWAWRGAAIYKHALVVGCLTWFMLGQRFLSLWWVALLIVLAHLLIDLAKVTYTHNGLIAFVVDQALHLAALGSVSWILCEYAVWEQWRWIPTDGELIWPATGAAYVFCWSSANYLIRSAIQYCRVDESTEGEKRMKLSDSVKRSGALIGSLERVIILTFILMGNYQAAGFTIAAKSLLRFNDKEAPRSEYVLVGTLMSLLIVLICAIVLLKIQGRAVFP